MSKFTKERSFEPIIEAANKFIKNCLVNDNSLFSSEQLWTQACVDEVRRAFDEKLDNGKDDFSTKLKSQMEPASAAAKRLTAEMLWALLLFPSNISYSRKILQIKGMWELSGTLLPENHGLLGEDILAGIGSGGPGYNSHRPREMIFLISLVRDLKNRTPEERETLLTDYDQFVRVLPL
jgi:5-methylcytosine-specific restriction enzyme B